MKAKWNKMKAKRKEFKNRETYLQGKLDALDNEICHRNNHFNQPLLDEYESIKTELKDIYEKKKAKKPCSIQNPAGLKKVRNLPIIFQFRKSKLWEKGYCKIKTWEWRDYFGHETNQPRNRIIL